jgi:hypothetical protein
MQGGTALSVLAQSGRPDAPRTCVIVLPWHDPIRVAEQIALLDVVRGGRTLMGFGRGARHCRIRRLSYSEGGSSAAICRIGEPDHQVAE